MPFLLTLKFLEANNYFHCAQKHSSEPYFLISISQICSLQKEKGFLYVFLVFVVCQYTAFWEQHKYAVFSPIFLLSHYFLSTFFAIFLSFISSSVIFPAYFSCTLTTLFSVPSLYIHIWVNLSSRTSPHFSSLLLSPPTSPFTFVSALRPFSTHCNLLLLYIHASNYLLLAWMHMHENWVFINSSELLTTEAFFISHLVFFLKISSC